jgi:hypothetical protein
VGLTVARARYPLGHRWGTAAKFHLGPAGRPAVPHLGPADRPAVPHLGPADRPAAGAEIYTVIYGQSTLRCGNRLVAPA